jgi:hypothetical protein
VTPTVHPARRARLAVGAASAGALVLIAGVLANQGQAASSPSGSTSSTTVTQTDPGSDGVTPGDESGGDDGFGPFGQPSDPFGQPGDSFGQGGSSGQGGASTPGGQPLTNSHGS